MKNETVIYEYLYQLILSQIYSGILKNGQRFPSQTELCRNYNVGITTARRVTRMLESQGCIRTSERKRPVVVWEADTQTYIEALLRRKNCVLDIYSGFKLILPALQLKGSRLYKTPDKLKSIISAIDDSMDQLEFYNQVSQIFMELLTPFNNRIIYDLQTDSENFTHIPYLPLSGLKDSYSVSPKAARKELTAMVQMLESKDYDSLGCKLYEIYDESHIRTKRYLDALERRFPAAAAEDSSLVFTMKNRANLYTIIARRIHLRIQQGEFNGCRYLPSVPDLMKEYSISQATAFRAVALLNDIGILSTIDKKGSVIAKPGMKPSPVRLDETTISENLHFFIDALQVLALCSENLAYAILSSMEEPAVNSALKLWDSMNAHSSSSVVRTLLEIFKTNAPCRCLSSIFEQLDYMLIWGHYLERKPLPIDGIEGKTALLTAPLRNAMASRDALSFSRLVQSLFQTAFETARQIMIYYGIDGDSMPFIAGLCDGIFEEA